jgi:uncharacterized repeat protein (TIGR03803 family)
MNSLQRVIRHTCKPTPTFVAMALLLASGIFAPRPAKAQSYTLLYSFSGGQDGKWPYSSLIEDSAGNLYGTASAGGLKCFNPYGCGTVFELNPKGNLTVLHSFTDDTDGGGPLAGVVRDSAGNLYGTTNYGPGASGMGTVFKLSSSNQETLLHTFTGMPDGASPSSPVVLDSKDNLYGTTEGGGAHNDGAVFEWNASTGHESVLYSFSSGRDGTTPAAGLLLDQAGRALYGEALQGGISQCSVEYTSGCGTVFRLTASGMEVYDFPGTGQKGDEPLGGLVHDTQGNFYGTTYFGGTSSLGSVFKIDSSGNETVLYSFTGKTDGAWPSAGLVIDSSGNLYGSTYERGDSSCNSGGGCGTVFEINSNGKFSVLHTFTGAPSDGNGPTATLLMDAAGNLYGTTVSGGKDNNGAVFKLTLTTTTR